MKKHEVLPDCVGERRDVFFSMIRIYMCVASPVFLFSALSLLWCGQVRRTCSWYVSTQQHLLPFPLSHSVNVHVSFHILTRHVLCSCLSLLCSIAAVVWPGETHMLVVREHAAAPPSFPSFPLCQLSSPFCLVVIGCSLTYSLSPLQMCLWAAARLQFTAVVHACSCDLLAHILRSGAGSSEAQGCHMSHVTSVTFCLVFLH